MDGVEKRTEGLEQELASADVKLAEVENKRKNLQDSLNNLALCTTPRIFKSWVINGKTGVDPLRSLAGFHAFLSVVSDPEARRAADALSSELKEAGLTVGPGTSVSGNAYIPDGVTVEWYSLANARNVFPFPTESFTESENAAGKIVDFLHSFNSEAKSSSGTPESTDLRPKSVRILVGLYPATELVLPPAMASVKTDWEKAMRVMKDRADVEFAKSLAEQLKGLSPDKADKVRTDWERGHREWLSSLGKWGPRDTGPCHPIDATK